MKFKPTTPCSIGGETHRRSHDENQQTAKSIRPQLPRDATSGGQNNVRGKMPAGFVSVWDFGNGAQTKWSPTSVKQKKVY